MLLKGHIGASRELAKVLEDAEEFAEAAEADLHSGHLLLALLSDEENRAQSLLEERGITWTRVLDVVALLDPEPVDTVPVILFRAAQFAERCRSDVAGTLHLLVGLCRVNASLAYRALERLGVLPGELRTQAVSYLTGGMPRRYKVQTATPPADRVDRPGPERPGPSRAAPVAVVEALREPDPEPDPDPDPEPMLESAPALRAPRASGETAAKRSRFALDPETFPMLTRYGRNLTVAAERGELDPVIGRAREVEQLVDVLNKRRANNPCLVGEPGVGKTAIVEALAQLIVGGSPEAGALGQKIVVELQVGSLVAGTQLRGAFSERLGALKEEVARADGRVVLFIDEIHTLVGAGAGDGALDAANELKTALARGEFPCIGATTEREYRRYIESDPALERRFQLVLVEEPALPDAVRVLEGVERHYSEHHNVQYMPEALEAAARLSDRWIHERYLPAKAIDVLDRAGALARRQAKSFVTEQEVAGVVAQAARVPVERLLTSDVERLLGMADWIRARVVGHDAAVARIAAVLRVNFAGFTSTRPLGSFLLLGPTGVGKTECARVVADCLFGSQDAVTRFDMTEYADAHSVSRLVGAPPGYVGHDNGGQLTEAVRRRPYQVLLFDEVEKASPEVLNVLLQLLEEGQVTDGRGRRVRFQHTVVFLTSNLGWEHFEKDRRTVGFGSQDAPGSAAGPAERALESARRAFAPELWNRLDEKLVFGSLSREHIERIAALLLQRSSDRLRAERRIGYRATPAVIPHLIESGGWDPRHGARPMRRTIQELVEGVVAEAILRGRAKPGDTLTVDVVDGRTVVQA